MSTSVLRLFGGIWEIKLGWDIEDDMPQINIIPMEVRKKIVLFRRDSVSIDFI